LGGAFQRTLSQKYAYAAQTTKKATAIAMKTVSLMIDPTGFRRGAAFRDGLGQLRASSCPNTST
jgi:hypothetical protein